MTIYAYIRVSTDKQEYDRQIYYLQEHGYRPDDAQFIEETYTGTKKSRPKWDELLALLQKGDTLVVESLSRIGRSLVNIIDIITDLVENQEVNVIVLKEGFNLKANGNMDASTRLMLNVFAAFAQFERDTISERTKEALKAKKEAGVTLGRRRGEKRKEIVKMLEEGYNPSDIAFLLDTCRTQVYRVKKEMETAE